MKKKFNQTKIGAFLTRPFIKSLVKAIPFGIGSIAGGILEENASPPGDIDRAEVYPQIFKLVIYSVLIYMALSGSISFEDAESAKGLLD